MNTTGCTNNLKTFIYGLSDPRCPASVRYVGKANDLKRRLARHVSTAKNQRSIINPRFLSWIQELLSDGIKPRMTVLEACQTFQWRNREKFWITKFRVKSENLLNIDDGGNGAAFIKAETRRRMSEAHRGKKYSVEHCRNIGLGQIGNKRGEETRKKQSELAKTRNIDYLQDPEIRARAGASLKNRRFSDAHRLALSVAAKRRWHPGGDMWLTGSPMRGRKHSEKTREKMRVAHAWRRHAQNI